MKECLVVGKVGAGKTLFVLNFAAYLGLARIKINVEYPSGQVLYRQYSIEAARRQLVGNNPHTTKALQSIILEIPVTKGVRRCIISDSSGLIDHIHKDAGIRQAIAQTLGAIRRADLILHVVDTSQIGVSDAPSALGEVDYQVAQFAQMRGGYLILANKIDLPNTNLGLQKLHLELPGHKITPISAMTGHGFKEVRAFVRRHL
ncbi:MAG TPA: GTP-binding protein HSR1 [Firmicutes bacterium]|nr:GTP-binding protein HSR1 [Bacillota bacterium]